MARTRNLSQGQIGAVLRVGVTKDGKHHDISAGSAQILIKKPDGVVLTKNAVFTSDGTDGLFQYATLSGDLDLAGAYEWQGKVSLPTATFHSPRNRVYVETVIA